MPLTVAAATDPTVVRTANGLVAGTDGAIRIYKGIPYARAERWRPPETPMAWSGVRRADQFGNDCPQNAPSATSRAPGQSEDCLSLNIWTPARPGDRPLPVMVWLHGGSFMFGSGSDARADGENFARQGVVLVSVNYRVGLFGFLAHPALTAESPHRASGNYGLLDLLAAFAWIRDNIAGFGGDAGRVTVFGFSAGSASISLLLASPLARGLFHQAILESPGGFRPLSSLGEAEAAGLRLGSDLDALRRLPAEDVLAKTGLLAGKMRGLTTARVLRPIRDGWVIPRDERPAFAAGRFMALPIIVGGNADEGTSLTAAWPIRTVAEYRNMVTENFGDWAGAALARYPVEEDGQVRRALADLFADTQFNYGVWALARAMSGREPRTWRYLFLRRRPGQQDGPHHGEEVAHVFGNLAASRTGQPAPFDATDRMVSAAIIGAWTRFAATGDPNGGNLPHWPAYKAGRDEHLEFADTLRVGARWHAEAMDFLDRYFDHVAG